MMGQIKKTQMSAGKIPLATSETIWASAWRTMVKKPVYKIGTSEYTLIQINELKIEDHIKSGLFRLKESPNKILSPNRERVTS